VFLRSPENSLSKIKVCGLSGQRRNRMSWSFDFIAENADALPPMLEKETHLPVAFRDALVMAACATAIGASQALHVKSSGHLGAYGGNASFELGYVTLARAPAVQPASEPPADPPPVLATNA
jgi:hypothetical protein